MLRVLPVSLLLSISTRFVGGTCHWRNASIKGRLPLHGDIKFCQLGIESLDLLLAHDGNTKSDTENYYLRRSQAHKTRKKSFIVTNRRPSLELQTIQPSFMQKNGGLRASKQPINSRSDLINSSIAKTSDF